jgi:thiamine pyrophosphokinase
VSDAVIVANGALDANARLRGLWQGAGLRLAADGGARHAREQLGLAPQVVIGDLDSLDQETRVWLEQQGAEFIRFPRAKNETDLELALSLALERGAEDVTLLGAFGGRVDQFLANVLLLTHATGVTIADTAGEVSAGTRHATIEGTIGDTVSLIPIDERVEGIITSDLEYPLREEDLLRGSTRGISNRLTATRAEVRWEKGLLLVVHLFDAAG